MQLQASDLLSEALEPVDKALFLGFQFLNFEHEFLIAGLQIVDLLLFLLLLLLSEFVERRQAIDLRL